MDTNVWVIVDQRTDDEDTRIVVHHDLGEAINSVAVLDGPKLTWTRVSRSRWEARLDGRVVMMAHRCGVVS